MATVILKGNATIQGISGTITALAYPLKQTGKLSHAVEEEVIKDENGFDISWLFRNEHLMLDLGIVFCADTIAHRETIQAILGPGSAITLAGFFAAEVGGAAGITGIGLGGAINGGGGLFAGTTWQVVGGGDVDMKNTGVVTGSYKLRKYQNATQNTAAVTTQA